MLGLSSLRGVAFFVGVVGLSACTASTSPPPERRAATESNMFFENSVRRDATGSEASRVAKLTTSQCAAFFLESTTTKTFVATARHCVEFAITSWCESDGKLEDNQGRAGRCVRVVAADVNHDIAVFEADLLHPAGDATLRLASYAPSANTKLVMIGYPADEDPTTARRGKLTTTVNCWTLGDTVPSPYAGQDDKTLDKSLRHNCTTYGGNSGGPMVVEGTREAIGLPFTYMPDDYQRRSATNLETAAYLALMADFTSVHRSELTSAGIVVSNGPSDPPPQSPTTETPPPTTSDTTGPSPVEAGGDDVGSDDADSEPSDSKSTKKKTSASSSSSSSTRPTTMSQGCAISRTPGTPTRELLWIGVLFAFTFLGLMRRRA